MTTLAEIRRIMGLMEAAAQEESDRLEAMSEDERAAYLRERNDAMDKLANELGLPREEICVGHAAVLRQMQGVLDGKPTTIH